MLRRRGPAAGTDLRVNEESADRVPATGRNSGKIVAWRAHMSEQRSAPGRKPFTQRKGEPAA